MRLKSERDTDRAIGLQVGLEQRGIGPRHAERRTVQGVQQLGLGVGSRSVAQVQAACLEIGVIGGGADLQPPANAG